MERIYSKENNTSENPFPRQEISLISQISRPREVRRSGQVTTFCCLSSFLVKLSSCHVTYENCSKSSGCFQSGLRWVDGFKKFQPYWVKELSLYNRIEAFFDNFH